MSTPIPPKLKLDDLDLYAPRQARREGAEESASAPPWTRRHAQDRRQQEQGETEERAAAAPGPVRVAQEQLDNAIRQAIEMACLDDQATASDAAVDGNDAEAEADDDEAVADDGEEEEADDGGPRLPPAPTLRAPLGGAADRLSAAADLRRADRAVAQAQALRRRGLESEILPEPPIGAEPRVAPLLLRCATVVGLAAIAAYAVTMIVSLQTPLLPPPTRTPDNAAATAAVVVPVVQDRSTTLEKSARLLVQNKRSFTNQPVELGISVDGGTGHESLLLAGLTAGTRLSAGEPLGDTRWQLTLNQLRNVYMYAPKDYVGVMNTAVNLLSPTAQLVDTKPVQFAWVAKALEPPVDRIEPGQRTAPIQPKDRAQEALMLKRGEDLLGMGDIAGARRVFQYLADGGNAEGALALGATFDSRFLAEHNAIGVAADDAKARSWYRRAADLGSTQAKTLLAQMADK